MAKLTDYLTHLKEGGYASNHTGIIKVYVPVRYEIHDFYIVDAFTTVLGIFQIEVEGVTKKFNLLLPVMLDMQPSSLVQYHSSEDDTDYYVLIFKKGDIFIRSDSYIKQTFVLGKLFKEFITNGHMPKWLTYNQIATVFDDAQMLSGVVLSTPHTCFEMMFAHCCRDPKHLNVKYRYSSMSESPVFLGLRDVSNIRDSVTSRLIGSYFLDGVNASIVNPSEQRSEVEDLLRM
jgi:hypothetical protein